MWVATLAGDVGAWVDLIRALMVAAGPMAVGGATIIVICELVTLRHLTRLRAR